MRHEVSSNQLARIIIDRAALVESHFYIRVNETIVPLCMDYINEKLE